MFPPFFENVCNEIKYNLVLSMIANRSISFLQFFFNDGKAQELVSILTQEKQI